MYRYLIAVIKNSKADQFGQVVGATNSSLAARRMADDIATDYQYGVAIIDLVTGIVDVGDGIFQLSRTDRAWWKKNWKKMTRYE
jgi:hypothetical protein